MSQTIAVMAAGALLLSSVTSAQAAEHLLQTALRSLATGNFEGLVSLYRHFEESVPEDQVAREKQGITAFFILLQEHFGRPDRVEASQATAGTFMRLFIESATPDLWRNSECVFKEYAFKTTFVKERKQRPADVLLGVCLDQLWRPVWLRSVDIRFSNPDEDTVQGVQLFFQQFQQEIQKVRGPRT